MADLPEPTRLALYARYGDGGPNLRKRGRPTGSDFFSCNPKVAAAVEAIVTSRRLAAPRILELLTDQFAQLPSLRVLQLHIAKLERERPALLAASRDPDAYKGRFRVALGRADASVGSAHEAWELDTTKADVMTKGGRVMVLGLIDRWSRRARFMVCPSESGQSVRRLLIDTIRAWGVMPAMVVTDNGSGFINESIRSALGTLGIEHRVCPPGSPEKKPFVERVFGTFMRERAELLAGYSGHNVADAQRLRARAKKQTGRAIVVPEMTGEELQVVLDAWTEGVYHQRDHSALRMSPMRKWLSSPMPAAAAPSEDVLKLALSALVGTRRVGKKGVVWNGGSYWSAACAEWMGRDVVVRRDEEDLGALFLFDEDGRYIDTAIDHSRSGLSEEQYAREARRHQAEWMKAQRAELRAASRHFDFDAARDAVLRRDAEAAGKVTSLPLPTRPHSTPTIDSIETAPAPPLPDARRLEQAFAHTATITPIGKSIGKSIGQKVAEADALIAADGAGEPVDAEQLRRARLYLTTSEYRAEKIVADHFATGRRSA